MPKQQREFFDPNDLAWESVQAGSGATAEGVVQKILSYDQETGDCTRLLKFQAESRYRASSQWFPKTSRRQLHRFV